MTLSSHRKTKAACVPRPNSLHICILLDPTQEVAACAYSAYCWSASQSVMVCGVSQTHISQRGFLKFLGKLQPCKRKRLADEVNLAVLQAWLPWLASSTEGVSEFQICCISYMPCSEKIQNRWPNGFRMASNTVLAALLFALGFSPACGAMTSPKSTERVELAVHQLQLVVVLLSANGKATFQSDATAGFIARTATWQHTSLWQGGPSTSRNINAW